MVEDKVKTSLCHTVPWSCMERGAFHQLHRNTVRLFHFSDFCKQNFHPYKAHIDHFLIFKIITVVQEVKSHWLCQDGFYFWEGRQNVYIFFNFHNVSEEHEVIQRGYITSLYNECLSIKANKAPKERKKEERKESEKEEWISSSLFYHFLRCTYLLCHKCQKILSQWRTPWHMHLSACGTRNGKCDCLYRRWDRPCHAASPMDCAVVDSDSYT